MKQKTCSLCKEILDLSEFNKDSRSKDGLKYSCRLCHKKYREKNKALIKIKAKKYWNENKEELKKRRMEKKKLLSLVEKEKERKRCKDYYKRNRKKILKACKEKNSTREQKDKKNARARDRYNNDPEFKLSINLRKRLNSAIKKEYKTGSAVRELGCSIKEFIKYLESKFEPGMTWDNWSRDGWHIDHIIPLAHFDLTDRKQLLRACHYTNLQPMWAKDNLKKGSKI